MSNSYSILFFLFINSSITFENFYLKFYSLLDSELYRYVKWWTETKDDLQPRWANTNSTTEG